ncbi:hypothetical protein PFAG_03060 [Plasmodium falciparum Santa Lucia]|uniref:Merozoite surface protein C-terminal domain-containing protein n=1 Tax=Plasmodium falciparum Santa Lucia TaxID=478859 RepID=W7G547_PLAFA|nr:hypothetical protein PFAG_03060 [Plasmodium falciparum Santa Lucia]
MLNIFNIIFLLFLINIYICEANGTLSENIESAEEIDALKTNLRNGYLNNTYFNEENNNLNIENEINNTNYNEVTEETKEELYDINENIFPDYFFLDIFTENKEQKNEEVPMKIEVVNDGEEVKTEYVSEKNEEVENKSETEIAEKVVEEQGEKVNKNDLNDASSEEIKDSSDFKESHEELFKVFLELINKNDLVKENLKKITNNLNEMHLSTLYP